MKNTKTSQLNGKPTFPYIECNPGRGRAVVGCLRVIGLTPASNLLMMSLRGHVDYAAANVVIEAASVLPPNEKVT